MKKILSKFSEYYIIFAVYCLIGWLYEVFMMWVVCPPYHFVNRGVLLGPFLPIYGFGMLVLLFLLAKFMSKSHKASNPLVLSISTVIITTFIFELLLRIVGSIFTHYHGIRFAAADRIQYRKLSAL